MPRGYARSQVLAHGRSLGERTPVTAEGAVTRAQKHPGKEESFKYLPGPETADSRPPQTSYFPYLCLLPRCSSPAEIRSTD